MSPPADLPTPSAESLEALDEYLRVLESVKRRSPNTLRNYRRDIEGFLAFLEARGVAFDAAGRQ